jgi:hypothetical protein
MRGRELEWVGLKQTMTKFINFGSDDWNSVGIVLDGQERAKMNDGIFTNEGITFSENDDQDENFLRE